MTKGTVETMTSARETVVARLKEMLGERCSTAQAVREQHGHGESYHPTLLPDAVCMPASTVEVA